MIEIMVASAEALVPANQEKCTRQYVPIAEKNVKFHLYLQKEDRCIAGIVSPNTENQDSNFFLFLLAISY